MQLEEVPVREDVLPLHHLPLERLRAPDARVLEPLREVLVTAADASWTVAPFGSTKGTARSGRWPGAFVYTRMTLSSPNRARGSTSSPSPVSAETGMIGNRAP